MADILQYRLPEMPNVTLDVIDDVLVRLDETGIHVGEGQTVSVGIRVSNPFVGIYVRASSAFFSSEGGTDDEKNVLFGHIHNGIDILISHWAKIKTVNISTLRSYRFFVDLSRLELSVSRFDVLFSASCVDMELAEYVADKLIVKSEHESKIVINKRSRGHMSAQHVCLIAEHTGCIEIFGTLSTHSITFFSLYNVFRLNLVSIECFIAGLVKVNPHRRVHVQYGDKIQFYIGCGNAETRECFVRCMRNNGFN